MTGLETALVIAMTTASSPQLDILASPGPQRLAIAEIARWSVGVLLALLAGTAAVVVWRRVAGALTNPLTPSLLLAIGLMAAMAACCTRLLWRRDIATAEPRRFSLPVALLPSASLLGIGISLSLPDTAAAGLWVFWALLAAEEGWAWQPALLALIRRQWRRRGRRTGDWEPGAGNREQGTGDRGQGIGTSEPKRGFKLQFAICNLQFAIASSVQPRPHPAPLPEGEGTRGKLPEGEGTRGRLPEREGTLLQQWTRTEAADGSEELLGWVRASFAAGQRTQNVHLAFCPSFAKTPELAVAQVDGPRSRVKTVQLLPYGARLELKLAAAAEGPTSVLLQFSARAAGGKGMRDEG